MSPRWQEGAPPETVTTLGHVRGGTEIEELVPRFWWGRAERGVSGGAALLPSTGREIVILEVVDNQVGMGASREFFRGRKFGYIPKSIVTLHLEILCRYTCAY